MRPLAHRNIDAVNTLAADRMIETRLHGVVVVEHTVDAAIAIKADAEVRTNRSGVARNAASIINDSALDNRLLNTRRLGPYPALHCELLEEVGGFDRTHLELSRESIGLHTVKIECLTAVWILKLERIGGRCKASYHFRAVKDEVAVCIVAFALFEAEHILELHAASHRRRLEIGRRCRHPALRL